MRNSFWRHLPFYFVLSLPFVVTGGAIIWLLKNWSLDSFKEALGILVLVVTVVFIWVLGLWITERED